MAETSVLNLSAFSAGELNTLLVAAKAEILTRLTGRVQTGSSTGQSFGMNLYTTDELNRLVNGLTSALGLDAQETRVAMNFSNPTGSWGGGPSSP